MLLSKPIEIPPIAVPINVTATMPMITPSAVRVERVMFERICATAIFQLSPSSYIKRLILISTDSSHIDFGNKSRVVAFDQTIAQMHCAPSVCGDVALMRNENDGVAPPIQIFEQRHDLLAGFGIEISGRFVSQDNGRLVHE